MRAERIKNPRIPASTVRVPGRAPQWVIPAVKLALVVGDALIAAFSFVGAFYFREGASIFGEPRMADSNGAGSLRLMVRCSCSWC